MSPSAPDSLRHRVLSGLRGATDQPSLGWQILTNRLRSEGAVFTNPKFYALLWQLVAEGLVSLHPVINNSNHVTDWTLH